MLDMTHCIFAPVIKRGKFAYDAEVGDKVKFVEIWQAYQVNRESFYHWVSICRSHDCYRAVSTFAHAGRPCFI